MTYKHFQQDLIAHLQKIEQELVKHFSSKTVIENALLLGTPSQVTLLQSCRSLYHHHLCKNYYHPQPDNIQTCVGLFTEIPYRRASMDFIILPHILESTNQAKLVLEEIAECLSQRGTLLLFASSTTSLSANKKRLFKAGLTVIEARSCFSVFSYYPNNKLMRFLDKTLTSYLPWLSYAYFIVAKKITTPGTLIPLQSRSPAKLVLVRGAPYATRIRQSSQC